MLECVNGPFEQNLNAGGGSDRRGGGAVGSGAGAGSRGKILSREELVRVRRVLREQGRRLVVCHGCFDIVHPGHVRHLRQAKGLGDVLLVSITADGQIGKGVGRPLIPEELRAENLAALEFVDLVHIAPEATAVSLLEAVAPDVYVKGKEYERNRDPRFQAERDAVERAGGRVVFSSGDVVFSSTALIAAMERSVDPYAARLAELSRTEELAGPSLYRLVADMRGRRVVVVGEPIIDTYILCDRPEVAGESPIMTLRPLEARQYDGGAMVLARHAAALGAQVTLVAPVPRGATARGGESDAASAALARLHAEGITVMGVEVDAPMPEKQRYLVGAQKVMKVDLLERYVLDAAQQARLVARAREACAGAGGGGGGGADCAIIADFGLGLFSPRGLAAMCDAVRPYARVLSGDVSGKRSNLRSFRGMDLLCPSESELRDAMHAHAEGLGMVAWSLMEQTRTRTLCVTMGADGLIGFDRVDGGEPDADPLDDRPGASGGAGGGGWQRRVRGEHVPALCPIALDPLGCGDALLTTTTLALAAGATTLQATFLGACAAATQVQRLGNTPITADDIRKCVARVHASHLAFAPNDARAGLAPAISEPLSAGA
jgi:rfaE bifunctional protein nucleotidyltransferase chain/domain